MKETNRTFRENGNPYKKRYSCSRNLKKPEVTVEVVKANEWRKKPSMPKQLEAAGYMIEEDSIVRDVDIFGFPFLRYELIRKGEQRERKVFKRRAEGEEVSGKVTAAEKAGGGKEGEAGRNRKYGSSERDQVRQRQSAEVTGECAGKDHGAVL
ncbi:MAG: hypothetical protein KBS39_04220 [Lachnospiraceae bacterium]|nr:hypothetical protein [Candidatus Hippenecus merdae]